MAVRFTLEYWRDGQWLVGQVREVPGVFSQGRTLRELEENVGDAYRLMLRTARPAVRRRRTRTRSIALAV